MKNCKIWWSERNFSGIFLIKWLIMFHDVDEIIYNYSYISIIIKDLKKSSDIIKLKKFKFQQDNELNHTAMYNR